MAKKLKQKPKFSKTMLLIIVLAVALSGGYLIYRSFAYTGTPRCHWNVEPVFTKNPSQDVHKASVKYATTRTCFAVNIKWGDGKSYDGIDTGNSQGMVTPVTKSHTYSTSPGTYTIKICPEDKDYKTVTSECRYKTFSWKYYTWQ